MKHVYRSAKSFLGLTCLFLLIGAGEAVAQTTVFTYQGRLTDPSLVIDGNYDMQFKLFDAGVDGNQVGRTLTFDRSGKNSPAVSVTKGVFAVQLDFGADAFSGADRFLEVAIKYRDEATFTSLPRQQITSRPYAIRSLNAMVAESASVADNAKQLAGVAATQYVQTSDARLYDSRQPKPGSWDYIQNTTTQQKNSSFSVSDDGIVGGTLSANTVNAATEYNLHGNRFLAAVNDNLSAGIDAGDGLFGWANSFFGKAAGSSITNGGGNTFVGSHAGTSDTSGTSNSFVGMDAGRANTTGGSNSFFGSRAGISNMIGYANSFVGSEAGVANTEGNYNSFFGQSAGLYNLAGSNNSFFGSSAGSRFRNAAGTNNTFIGSGSDASKDGLDHATAIGAGSVVNSNNTVVLGRGADTVQVPGNLVVATLGAAGKTKLCLNASNQLADCSSSLRYKTNIAPFSSGLRLIKQLRPISFDWKTGGPRDVGFGAEEVAAIDPLFVNYNAKGQVEGVQYDRLSVAFVNAFKEQQTQIEQQGDQLRQQRGQLKQQRDQLKQQQNQLDALKKFVCLDHPNAEWCK